MYSNITCHYVCQAFWKILQRLSVKKLKSSTCNPFMGKKSDRLNHKYAVSGVDQGDKPEEGE